MTATDTKSVCPSCGKTAKGRFCEHCGNKLEASGCAECGRPLSPGAKFCPQCGTPSGARRAPAPATNRVLIWAVPGIAVVVLVAFLIGQRVALGSAPAAADSGTAPLGGPMAAAPFAGAGAAGGRVPDISSMSPEERASRLFDRVMRYGEEGKADSARIFAPMAIQAYEMLGPLDLHRRYDVGMIALVSGSADVARSQADTILKQNPTHLLGLILAMKTAAARQDVAGRAGFEKRFRAAEATERTKPLPEYVDHKADLDNALKAAKVP
jgi:hypothetical protein